MGNKIVKNKEIIQNEATKNILINKIKKYENEVNIMLEKTLIMTSCNMGDELYHVYDHITSYNDKQSQKRGKFIKLNNINIDFILSLFDVVYSTDFNIIEVFNCIKSFKVFIYTNTVVFTSEEIKNIRSKNIDSSKDYEELNIIHNKIKYYDRNKFLAIFLFESDNGLYFMTKSRLEPLCIDPRFYQFTIDNPEKDNIVKITEIYFPLEFYLYCVKYDINRSKVKFIYNNKTYINAIHYKF